MVSVIPDSLMTENNDGTPSKLFKFANRARTKVRQAFSSIKTAPSKLKHAFSSMMRSGSSTNLRPTSVSDSLLDRTVSPLNTAFIEDGPETVVVETKRKEFAPSQQGFIKIAEPESKYVNIIETIMTVSAIICFVLITIVVFLV